MNKFSIAIDGPAGAGKSSIAKLIAKALNCIYIDTGAMYRAVGYYCIKNNLEYKEEERVSSCLDKIQLKLVVTEEGQRVLLNDEDISERIRNDEVAAAASKVATYQAVRTALVTMQQEMEKEISVVMDGRDIGTVVMPNATLKIFLTASVEERALRRLKDYELKGKSIALEVIKNEIEERDYQDSHRAISPLKKAEDAIVIDTTALSIEAVVARIIELIEARL